MRKLSFNYEMKLTFSGPVTEHRFQLRCIPATRARQQVIDVLLKVEPTCHLDMMVDSFGSVVATGYLPEPHNSFSYSVTGIAFVDVANAKSDSSKPLYRYDTELTSPGPSLHALINTCKERVDALGPNARVLARAQEVMHCVLLINLELPA